MIGGGLFCVLNVIEGDDCWSIFLLDTGLATPTGSTLDPMMGAVGKSECAYISTKRLRSPPALRFASSIRY